MLDSDLADLYCVLTKNLNKAVKRNIDKERKRILDEIEKIEQQSNATRTPLYQETLIQLIRDRINNG